MLLTAGVAVSHGFLWMLALIAIAAISSFLGDQTFFYLGRRYGTKLLARFPSLQSRAARVNALLEHHHVPLILAVRFMCGLRIAGPLAIGMSTVRWSRFLVLNLVGAITRAIMIASISYGLGQGLVYLFGSLDADEAWLPVALLLPTDIWWFITHGKRSIRATRL